MFGRVVLCFAVVKGTKNPPTIEVVPVQVRPRAPKKYRYLSGQSASLDRVGVIGLKCVDRLDRLVDFPSEQPYGDLVRCDV